MRFLMAEIKEAQVKNKMGLISGWANRYMENDRLVIDRQNDIIWPGAFKGERMVPLLLDHDPRERVGSALIYETEKKGSYGLWFDGALAIKSESARLRDRAIEAFDSVKMGIIRSLSIGFTPLEMGWETIEGKRVRVIKQLDVGEVSLVSVPANPLATVEAVKGRAGRKSTDWVINPFTGENYGITWGELREELKKAASRAGHGIRLDQLADYVDSYRAAKAIQELAGSPIGQLAMNR